MLFFKPRNPRERGNQLSGIDQQASEEKFYLKREKALQERISINAKKVADLRKEVSDWYEGDGDEVLAIPVSAKYPINPDK